MSNSDTLKLNVNVVSFRANSTLVQKKPLRSGKSPSDPDKEFNEYFDTLPSEDDDSCLDPPSGTGFASVIRTEGVEEHFFSPILAIFCDVLSVSFTSHSSLFWLQKRCHFFC